MAGRKIENKLKYQYRDKFEVYLISDLNDKPLYAGQGKVGIRVFHHFQPSGLIKFNKKKSELKILYRVIVENKQEALDLEERFINKFKPELNMAQRDSRIGVKHSEKSRKKMSQSRFGKSPSDESRLKMSESQKKRWAKSSLHI